MECENCSKKCPQMELADECAKGRMYATQELIKCQKELEQLKATIKEIRENTIDEFLEKAWDWNQVSHKRVPYAFTAWAAEYLRGGNDHEQNYQGNT